MGKDRVGCLTFRALMRCSSLEYSWYQVEGPGLLVCIILSEFSHLAILSTKMAHLGLCCARGTFRHRPYRSLERKFRSQLGLRCVRNSFRHRPHRSLGRRFRAQLGLLCARKRFRHRPYRSLARKKRAHPGLFCARRDFRHRPCLGYETKIKDASHRQISSL